MFRTHIDGNPDKGGDYDDLLLFVGVVREDPGAFPDIALISLGIYL
jgi:hypothetical protein